MLTGRTHPASVAVHDPARSHPWPGAGLWAGFTTPAAPAPDRHPAELVATPRNDTVGWQVANLNPVLCSNLAAAATTKFIR